MALVFAAIKFAIQLAANVWQAHLGYGYFRDEMYYLECGRHLAWGYVDHGPGVAVQARLAELLFGKSLAGIRVFAGLAGAARVLLTGILAWSLGGRRPAQALAMIGVLVAPQYLSMDGYLSMNSVESVFWMGCVLALILMVRGGSERLWLVFGVSAGLGLLNKPSMTFFLVALLFALLVTRQRRLLFNRWSATGVVLLVLIAMPNLLWQIHHNWPTLEFLRDGLIENKNVKLGPVAFLVTQIVNLQPLTLLIWGAGVIWLLHNAAAKSWRWIGITYVVFLPVMMALHAKDYYVAPIYPVLFAAGGIAWEMRFAGRRRVAQGRAFAFPILETVMLVFCVLVSPMSFPVLRPTTWIAYTKATGLYKTTTNSENEATGVLPQFYADRFGWQEEVDEVSRIYQGLSAEDKAKVGIICSNYGEASAIDFLGHGLPPAISGHNNYYLWGPHGATGEVMIIITGGTVDDLKENYSSVEIVGRMDNPYSMPYERRNIYLARGRKTNLTTGWWELKRYI